ncbi:MAG: tetratricopeptide repeat protein [Candidatus Eremiobacteraeota bacterium]|nr:tetratricopeptide repeat protein [Candidatus Eremiobacteraeota bacterium]
MKDSKGFSSRGPGGSPEKPVMGKGGLEQKGFLKKKVMGARGEAQDDEEAATAKRILGDIGEDLEGALQEVEEALGQDPRNDELHIKKYQILKRAGDKEALVKALEEAIAISQNHFFATKLAEHWEEHFKYEQALKWRQKVAELKPEDAYTIKRLAIAYVRSFRFAEAEKAYQKAFALQPEVDDLLGHTFFQEMQGVGFPKEKRADIVKFGIEIAKKALALRPQSIAMLEGTARLARIGRENESAISFFEKLIALREAKESSGFRQWKGELLRIYAREGLDEKWKKLNRELIDDYKEFLAKNTADSNGWLQLALQQIQGGFFEDSIGSLKNAIDADPKNVQALYELGRILVRLNRSQEAIEYYLSILPGEDDLASRMKYHRALELCLADLYYRLARFEEALSLYRREESSNARYIGIVLEASGEDQEALSSYHTALEMSPRDGRNYLALSEYHVRRSRWQEAEETAIKGLECPHITKEAHEQLYVVLATAKMKTKKIDEALKVMDEAIESSPELLNMEFRRIKLLFLQGKVREAKAAGDELIARVERMLKCAPSASDLWSLLGDMSSLLGQFEKARDAYAQAMKYNAMDSEAVRGEGVLAEKFGEYDKAIELFSRFIMLEPLSLSTPPLREKIKLLSEKAKAGA